MMLSNFTHLRAGYKAITFAIVTMALVPAQLLWMILFATVFLPKNQSPIVRLWYRLVLKIFGAKIHLINKRNLSKRQKIFVSNHITYLDILALGAAFNAFFVAKADIAGWPIFGFLAKTGGTIFISRTRRDVKNQLNLLQKHLKAKQNLWLFPESTTSNGRQILPFKSSLFNAPFTSNPLPVIQPVSIAYTHLDGNSITEQSDMDKLAWYADMDLAPHLWNLLRHKSFTAKISVHSMISITDEETAKTLALQSEKIIHDGFTHALPEFSATAHPAYLHTVSE